MPAASACAVSSPAVASGTCRPPPTTCGSYTGSLSAAPDQPQRGTPTATGPSSEPPEARQGRRSAMLEPLQTTTPGHSATASRALLVRPADHQRRHPLPRRVAQNQTIQNAHGRLPKGSLESRLDQLGN